MSGWRKLAGLLARNVTLTDKLATLSPLAYRKSNDYVASGIYLL